MRHALGFNHSIVREVVKKAGHFLVQYLGRAAFIGISITLPCAQHATRCWQPKRPNIARVQKSISSITNMFVWDLVFLFLIPVLLLFPFVPFLSLSFFCFSFHFLLSFFSFLLLLCFLVFLEEVFCWSLTPAALEHLKSCTAHGLEALVWIWRLHAPPALVSPLLRCSLPNCGFFPSSLLYIEYCGLFYWQTEW